MSIADRRAGRTTVAADPLARFHEHGQAAAQRGEPLDACRYRRADRVNAWVRGWHAAEDQRLRLKAFEQAPQAASQRPRFP